ncbi:hypothetical protein [Streptomyces sp. bgisy130]|uniref:hypothetical protein n=1 Tax=Streptomyces sp. bgisy130 TaxID=3413788 RepID=UPI003F49CE01
MVPRTADQGDRRPPRDRQPANEQLYKEAQTKNLEGRSTMSKDELRRAVGR